MTPRPLTCAERKLVEDHLDLVQKSIRWSHIHSAEHIVGLSTEELVQEGLYWLCRAAEEYQGDRGTSFQTFAVLVIRNGLYSYCRKCQGQASHEIISEDIELIPESGVDQGLELLEVLETLKSHYRGVTRRGIEVMELRLRGFNGQDIARKYGVPANHVRAWMSRAATKLRRDPKFLSYVEK